MNEEVRDTIDFLVSRYHLHEKLPVDLTPLLENFTIRRYPLSQQTLGFTVIMDREVHIGLNELLSTAYTRQTLAHETGHIIACHPNMHYTSERNMWFKHKLEHEAQSVAAYLLVPSAAVKVYQSELSAHELADILDVPVALVDLRWSQACINGENF